MTFEEVFSYKNLYNASRKCRLGVGWKPSTQRYLANEARNISKLHTLLHSGKYKALPFGRFKINERGKVRDIKSCHIRDRVVQKCLCESCLLPLLVPKLIYDNGACMKNKGVEFARRRLVCHLQRHYRKHGTSGYILLFDFKAYFDSIPHDLLIEKISKLIDDERIIKLYSQLVRDMQYGLGLGSQISQISAVYYLNDFDHYIKEKLGIKGYGRYMDDGYLIHESKEYLQRCLAVMQELCTDLKLHFNMAKTQIVRLDSGFCYLKQFWRLTGTGRVVRKVWKKNITRQRRKLKSFKEMLAKRTITIENIKMSQQSWKASIERINARRQIYNMDLLFGELFAT